MNDDWFKPLHAIAQEAGKFFEEIGRELDRTTTGLLDLSEEVANEVDQTLEEWGEAIEPTVRQLDSQLNTWLDPFLYFLIGFETSLDETVQTFSEPLHQTITPFLDQHPVCVGCRHYHGQSYNGNLLVCGMHPYGMSDGSNTCPDKELISWSFSDRKDDRGDQN